MSSQQSISVKVSFDEEMRRFPFPKGGSFAQFNEGIISLLGIDRSEKIVLKYVDEEGDMVTLSSDLELQSAINGPILRITAVRKGTSAPPTPIQSASIYSAPSTPVPISTPAPAPTTKAGPIDLMDIAPQILGSAGSVPHLPSTPLASAPTQRPIFGATGSASPYVPAPAPIATPTPAPVTFPFSLGPTFSPAPAPYSPQFQPTPGLYPVLPPATAPTTTTTTSINNDRFPDLSPLSEAMDTTPSGSGQRRERKHGHPRVQGRGQDRDGLKHQLREARGRLTPEEWAVKRMQYKEEKKLEKQNKKEEKREYKEQKKEEKKEYKEQKKEDKKGMREWKKDRKEWKNKDQTPEEREAFKQKWKETKEKQKAERAARVEAGRGMGQDVQKLDARHSRDVTIPDGTEIPANTPFVKTWRVRNEGAPWPAGCSLLFISKHRGDLMGGPESVPVPYEGPIPTNQEIDISVSLVAPSKPGRYMGFWKMVTPEGRKFGQRMWVSITVPSTSSSSSSEGEADKIEALVDTVLAMGFDVKRHRVFHLLQKNDGDVEKVAVKLAKKAAKKASKAGAHGK